MMVREYMPPVYQDWHNTSPVTMPCAPWEPGQPFAGLKPRAVIEAKTNALKNRAQRQETILAHLRTAGGWHTARDVARHLHMSSPETANALLAMCADGRVQSRPTMVSGSRVNSYSAVTA